MTNQRRQANIFRKAALLLGAKRYGPSAGGGLRPNLKVCQEGQHPARFRYRFAIPPQPMNSAFSRKVQHLAFGHSFRFGLKKAGQEHFHRQRGSPTVVALGVELRAECREISDDAVPRAC